LQFPDDEQGFEMEDQVYLGDSGILVHPVVKQGADSVNIYLGETQVLAVGIFADVDLLRLYRLHGI